MRVVHFGPTLKVLEGCNDGVVSECLRSGSQILTPLLLHGFTFHISRLRPFLGSTWWSTYGWTSDQLGEDEGRRIAYLPWYSGGFERIVITQLIHVLDPLWSDCDLALGVQDRRLPYRLKPRRHGANEETAMQEMIRKEIQKMLNT